MNMPLVCLLFFRLAVPHAALPAAAPDIAGEVRALLDAQVAAWNRGDLAAFLEGYRHGPDLTFYSNGATMRGFESVQARYETSYGSAPAVAAKGASLDVATMGKLSFEDLEIIVLAPDAAFARGRFRLRSSAAGPARTGLFSLLLRKTARWEIVHDHTSIECVSGH